MSVSVYSRRGRRDGVGDLLVQRLAQSIRGGEFRPGQRIPTIRQIARQHKVSPSAAHTAIKSLERRGLVETVHGSGTFVRAAAGGADHAATKPIAYLFLDVRPHMHSELGQHLVHLLGENRITAVRASWAPGMHLRYVDHLLPQWESERPRAVVLQGYDAKLDDAVRRALPRDTRVVTVMRSRNWLTPGWHTVDPDFEGAYALAAQHLIARGHKRIGLLAKERRVTSSWPGTRRKALMMHTLFILAMGKVMADAGLRRGLTIHYNRAVNADPSGVPTDEPNVARMAKWLSGPSRPTAVVAEDFRLVGLKIAAQRVGLRIPEDLAIVGVGSATLGQVGHFPVVSYRYDLIAQEAARIIADPQPALGEAIKHVIVPPVLVDSTGSAVTPSSSDAT